MTTYQYFAAIKFTADGSTTLSEAATRLEAFAKHLRELEAAGLQLDTPIEGGMFTLITEDEVVAKRFGFQEVEENNVEELAAYRLFDKTMKP